VPQELRQVHRDLHHAGHRGHQPAHQVRQPVDHPPVDRLRLERQHRVRPEHRRQQAGRPERPERRHAGPEPPPAHQEPEHHPGHRRRGRPARRRDHRRERAE